MAPEDSLTDDVASGGAATERTNDLRAKMIVTVCQGFSISDAGYCQGTGDKREQR